MKIKGLSLIQWAVLFMVLMPVAWAIYLKERAKRPQTAASPKSEIVVIVK